MTKYAEIIDSAVVTISSYPEAHRVAVDDSVFCGFADNGDGTFSAAPAPPKYTIESAKAMILE